MQYGGKASVLPRLQPATKVATFWFTVAVITNAAAITFPERVADLAAATDPSAQLDAGRKVLGRGLAVRLDNLSGAHTRTELSDARVVNNVAHSTPEQGS
jgi:hypothetical protein